MYTTTLAKHLSSLLQEQTSYHHTTLAGSVSCKGVGVHSGRLTNLTISPGKPGQGIVFVRTDVKEHNEISASYDHVVDATMSTRIANANGVSVSTVEHVIAALAGLGINTATLYVDGPEIPIMDGSSKVFVDMLQTVQRVSSPAQGSVITILSPVEIKTPESFVRLVPSDETNYDVNFNFSRRFDQTTSFRFNPLEDDFSRILAPARTFGFYEDAEKLWAAGLAKGTSLDNTIVIKKGKVINEEGLRFQDEMVRHKVLDAIGDLALAGVKILGKFEALNPGHSLNNQLLRKLFNTPNSWCFVN